LAPTTAGGACGASTTISVAASSSEGGASAQAIRHATPYRIPYRTRRGIIAGPRDRDDRREDAGRPRVRRNATRAATFAPMSLTFSGLPRIDLRRTSDGADQHSWRARCHRSAGLSGEADHVAREIIAA